MSILVKFSARFVLVLAVAAVAAPARALPPPSPFRPAVLSAVPASAIGMTIGDLDGDGALDVIVLHGSEEAPGTFSILRGESAGGRGTGRLLAASPFSPNVPHRISPHIQSGSFKDPTRLDLIVTSHDPTAFTHRYVHTLPGIAIGLIGGPVTTEVASSLVGGTINAIAAGDFNEDGRTDLVLARSRIALELLLGNGSGNVSDGHFTALPFAEAGSVVEVVSADFDGDGHLDIAGSRASLGVVTVRRGDGAGAFSNAGDFAAGTSPQALKARDMTGDGRVDLIVANSPGTVSVLKAGPGGQPFSFVSTGAWPTGSPVSAGFGGPYDLAIGDWNRDGVPDIAVSNPTNSTVGVLFGLGGGTFQTPLVIPVAGRFASVATADLDENAADDLVVLSPDGRVVEVLLGNLPPDCGAAVGELGRTWPANGRLTPVAISGVTDPDGDAVTIAVTSVTQDEPLGSTCPDARIVAGAAEVRLERDLRVRNSHPGAFGNGRVYAIHFTATDSHGATCEGTVAACVPLRRNGECVDDGPIYASLGPCGPGQRVAPDEAGVPGDGGAAVPGLGLAVVAATSQRVEFEIAIPDGAAAMLSVFDVTGRRVGHAAERDLGAGTFTWSRLGLAAGLYFAELRAGAERRVVRFALQ